MLVVHDFVADIDGRAPFAEGFLDDLDGAIDARAKATRGGEPDLQFPAVH